MKTRKAGRTWNDLRETGSDRSAPTAVMTPIATQPIAPLVEASAIQVDETGTIALVVPQALQPNPATCSASMTTP
jgi:hypothetical protein